MNIGESPKIKNGCLWRVAADLANIFWPVFTALALLMFEPDRQPDPWRGQVLQVIADIHSKIPTPISRIGCQVR